MSCVPVLEAIHLTKRYGSTLALDDLCLTINRGEVVGLLGPNGAGKTTTVNLLLGVLTPTSGEVRLFGQSLARHRSELLARVNFASAYAGLPRNLTLRENLRIFAELYAVDRPDVRIAEVLEQLELTELASRTVLGLSAGQRMRTVLAKALLSRPELLLLDEPTASLDPESAGRVRELLSGLPRQGVTLLWTSHNMAEVERACTRVVFLHRGRVFLDGPPRELARRAGEVLVRYRREDGAPADREDDGWQTAAVPGEMEAAALIARLQHQGGLVGLEVRHPTLEDLFLRLAREQLEPNGEAP